MTEMILQGRLPAKDGQRDQLVSQLLRAAELMQSDPLCHVYLVGTKDDDPEGVYVTEIWANAEAHAASLTRDDVRALIRETMPLVGGAPSGTRLRAAGGKRA